jgi:hydrogenase maturation protein HypF
LSAALAHVLVPRVTIVGLGHALLGDDGLGLAIVRALERDYVIPAAVTLVDAGSCGLDLVGYLLDTERLIFVDAVIGEEPPGTVRTVGEAELRAARPSGPRFAPHEPAIHDALALLDLIGEGLHEALLVGIVPASLEIGVELSAPVAAAVPRAVDEVVRHLARFGVYMPRRGLTPPEHGLHIELEGVVQGVGMRPWLQRSATRLGLRGAAANVPTGVSVDVSGREESLAAFVAAIEQEPPPRARIDAVRVTARDADPSCAAGFVILKAVAAAGTQSPSIPADLAMCEACRREIDDPADRRYQHGFASCTDCGPRFAIVTDLPYDRERTTMAEHPMCAECTREHADPADRRHWAQATSCPACGPRHWVEAPFGTVLQVRDPAEEAARRILAGEIVAVQGLGGIHLACDAMSEHTVARLRARKRREAKPFAVLVTLEMASDLAVLDDAALAALTSPSHPIVIATRRASSLAANVAPGSTRVGLLLPYTPFHHLLLEAVGRPLVLTSGNGSGEPLAITREDARRTLGDIADALVFHDRVIVRRVEDSVVAIRAGRCHVLRRSRGYAPRPVRLPAASPEPVLALGGHLKSTACIVVGDLAYLTPHLGDLESHEAEQAYRADVEGLERLLGVRPRVVVHDLHPGYASTRYAAARPESVRLGVQHHHAHALAVAAEQQIEGPFIAAVLDGMGHGLDATAWGAEILAVDGGVLTRPFTTRPLELAGGDRATREVWRAAAALLRDAFGAEEAEAVLAALPLGERVAVTARAQVGRMLDTGVNVVRARGMGRYFDAFGALCLGYTHASFEGEVAIALEDAVLVGSPATPYPYASPRHAAVSLSATSDSELDLRPTTRAVVADLLAGEDPRRIAGRFHATIVAAFAELVERAAGADRPIVLAGGCLQNATLDAGLRARLGRAVPSGEVPINDGGLALGQAWAGVLALRAGEV